MSRGRTQSLCLLSGGLDSTLAACMVREQRIDLRCVVFTTPIWDAQRAKDFAAELGLDLEEFDFTARLFDVFARCPKLDDVSANLSLECHAEILHCGVDLLGEYDCDFVVTGEVLNQNGHTQSQDNLISAAAYSGRPEFILRPLSARRLPPTEPEKLGWVNRDALGDVEGEQQDEQGRLAERFGIAQALPNGTPDPLDDAEFIARLHDLRGHEGLGGKRSFALLTVGRHFRLGPVTKLVVGRTAEESAELEDNAELYDLIIKSEAGEGPVGLLPFLATDDQIRQAAGICARYAGAAGRTSMAVRSPRGMSTVHVDPALASSLELVEILPRPPASDDEEE